ncbi:MAG: hypothetical protein HRT89_11355 [Lentisphaeria bacterium]|nr:hypothetical protein [Lentisphaeria bacterium]NQZ68652.1 hypothetical protein [Lentisphaeria bacterium]
MSLLRRRRLGPAFERHPSARISEWTTRNMMILTGGACSMVLVWIAVFFGVKIINVIATEGHDNRLYLFYQDTLPVILTKLIGGFLAFIYVASSKTK